MVIIIIVLSILWIIKWEEFPHLRAANHIIPTQQSVKKIEKGWHKLQFRKLLCQTNLYTLLFNGFWVIDDLLCDIIETFSSDLDKLYRKAKNYHLKFLEHWMAKFYAFSS